MMEYIYIGKISTTHGIKGELKIRSNFKYKENAFVVGNEFYIGNNKEKFKVLSYRKHQDYDMVTLQTLDDIDKVIKYKGNAVYMKKEDLHLKANEYTNEDYINSKCIYNDYEIGRINDIIDAGASNYLFEVKGEKKIYIPKNENFIEKFDVQQKTIYLKNMEGLL